MLDPIHGFISVDELEKKIIDTPLFQRLGYIKQLTSAYHIFPGGQHTRKSHSIGAMHLSKKYIKAILNNPRTCSMLRTAANKDEIISYVSVAALLHDVAHGPFSHSFDSTVYAQIYGAGKGHDIHRFKLVDTYFKNCKNIPEYFDWNKVKDIWKGGKDAETFFGKEYGNVLKVIISGPCSVDRGDFLKRDSYFCGINYGVIDMDRIMDNCWIDRIDEKLVFVYDSKVVKSMIQGLVSRLYLYEEIYLNKHVIAMSILIELMILEANSKYNYANRVNNIEEFIYLNDDSIFYEILWSKDPSLESARKYARMIYERKVPKLESEEVLTVNKDIHHKEGIQILERGGNVTKVMWTSRGLSKDFVSEFEKYNIHISHNNKFLSFREYYNSDDNPREYYFQRVYVL